MKNNKAIESLKKGHLYFHNGLNRVERITEVFSHGIANHRHHSEVAQTSTVQHFRKATAEEVKAYLGK